MWKTLGLAVTLAACGPGTRGAPGDSLPGDAGVVTRDMAPRPPDAPASIDEGQPAPGALLIEEFETPAAAWEPFLNYWRLHEEQWHLSPGLSDDGSTALHHEKALGVADPDLGAHDAVYMYQASEAEGWTDYRYEASVYLSGIDKAQAGLWLRGIAKPTGEGDGKHITGYYFVIKSGSPKIAYLMQLRTDDECGDDCAFNYHFSNPLTLEQVRGKESLGALGITLEHGRWAQLAVEVRGPRIQCFVDGHQVFDYLDDIGTTFLQGTVGFFTYEADDARFDHVRVESL